MAQMWINYRSWTAQMVGQTIICGLLFAIRFGVVDVGFLEEAVNENGVLGLMEVGSNGVRSWGLTVL